MRRLLRGAALLLGLGTQAPLLGAQSTPAAAPTAAAVRSLPPDLAALLEQVRRDPSALALPSTDSIVLGDLTIPAGTTVGRVAVGKGTLDVQGTVRGDAMAVGGSVVVRPGAHVTGDVFAAGGTVRVDSGAVVDGEIRTIGGEIGALPFIATRTVTAPTTTRGALSLAVGWLAVLLVLGLGVLVMAGEYLDGVLDTLERGVIRAFWIGLAGQLLILPGLLVLVVALAITILGALLIPFAIVAYAFAVIGLVTLGFLAVAVLAGHAVGRAPGGATERGAALRALVTGLAILLGLWVLAAAFTWSPVLGAVLRTLAFAVCWVAATAGFGAAMLSRGGTRRVTAPVAARALPVDDFSWQTPTPVSGIAAARRPTPAPPPRNPA